MSWLRIQLQDNGQVPRWLVDMYRHLGFRVGGMIRPSFQPIGGPLWTPPQTAEFIAEEKRRLTLELTDENFEREVRDADSRGENWSAEYVSLAKELNPGLQRALDTNFGDFAGGIENHYTPNGWRFNVQTFWGANGIWDDPPTNIVRWCAGAQPRIPRNIIKPIFRVAPNDQGERCDIDTALDDTVKAGTKGIVLYYLEGADVDYLTHFTREAIRRGVAYP